MRIAAPGRFLPCGNLLRKPGRTQSKE